MGDVLKSCLTVASSPPGQQQQQGQQAGRQSNAATRRLPQPYLFFCSGHVTTLRSLIATSPHMAQLLDSPCSPSLSRSYSFSLTRRLTDASPPSSSAAFRCFFVFFFAACCFRMLIFFRFLFWRPLPKQRPSALVFLCCFSYDVFFSAFTPFC